jgi:hypothetical protein
MKKDTIQFYIYPDGIADSMGSDELVLVRNKLGSVDTKFVSDLVEGDYYCERIPAPLPPRNAEDIIRFIEENELTFNYVKDGWNKTAMLEVVKGKNILISTDNGEGSIRKAIEPLMDMEEL